MYTKESEIVRNMEITAGIQYSLNATHKWLANRADISVASLSSKMSGKVFWSQYDLDKINKVLKTNFKL